MNKHDRPSAFHEAQRAIWKAKMLRKEAAMPIDDNPLWDRKNDPFGLLIQLKANLLIQRMAAELECEKARGRHARHHELFCRLSAAQEVEIMEYREMRDDPESTIEAVNLIQRIRAGG